MKNPILKFAVTFAALLALSGFSFAGPALMVSPRIGLGWRYDGNYYETENNERGVHTYAAEPGIELVLSAPKSSLSLDYTLLAMAYDDADDLKPGEREVSDANYVGHSLSLNASTQATSRIQLGLEEAYDLTRDPDKLDRFSNVEDKDKYQINHASAFLLYDFGERFSAKTRYQNIITDYISGLNEDNAENRGVFDVIYHFTPRTSLDLEYQVWRREYDRYSSDYLSNQGKLILRQELHYFTVEAGAGYQNRNFDESYLSDSETFTYRVVVEGKNPPDGGEPRSYIRLGVESNFNDAGSGDEYYKGPQLSAAGGHVFLEKIYVDLWLSYGFSDYESTYGLTPGGVRELRDDTIFNSGARLGYRIIDPVVVSVEGGFKTRDSNIKGFDYDNSYIMLRVDGALEFGRPSDI